MEFFINNVWIIPALPLWSFLLILFGRIFNVYENKYISLALTAGSTFIGFISSIFILFYCINNPETSTQYNILWLDTGNLKFSIGWLVDNLAAMMLVVVTSISLLIQIYSHGYMEQDKGYHRFFAYLVLFNFSMLALVLSTNLFQTYIFWELVGVSSYLLIGFWFYKPSAAQAAKKAFIINRIGDCGLLVGTLALLFYSLNWWTSSQNILLEFATLGQAGSLALANAGPVLFGLLALGLLFGPIAKSAQIPLHTWLADAMEGPTPISALIHAATMVAAGVYLIARLYPVFELSPQIMTIMVWVGAITAFIAATIAITQTDIKKCLAYSTCSQLGYMVLAMGVGAYSAGLFHLITHAYFKAMLFLCSGAVIHSLADQQNMKYMGGLRKKIPIVAYTYLIGTLAIAGLFLSGFWSKEAILLSLYIQGKNLLLIIALITAFMTAYYMFRSYFMVFEGEYRGHAHFHKPSKIMTVPLIILAVPSALIGFIFSGSLKSIGIGSFDSFIFYGHALHEAHVSLFLPICSLIIATLGFLLAGIIYWDKLKSLYCNCFKLVEKYFSPLYKLSTNKWYFDDFNNLLIKYLILPISELISIFDKYVIDGFINLCGISTLYKGKAVSLLQNGNIQTYLVTALLSFIAIITVVFLIYII